MRSILRLAAVAACVLALGSPARAALSYAFAFEAPLVQALPGQTVQIDVFLVETFTDGDSSLIADENGLSGAEVTVTRDAVGGLTDPARIIGADNNIGPTTDPTAFDSDRLGVSVTPPEFAQLLPFDLSDAAVYGTLAAPGVREVLLGTISIEAGLVVGEVTTFTASDDPNFDDTATATATDLGDGAIDGDFGIDPDAVAVEVIIPEPTTLALVALGGVALIRRRAR